MAAGLLGSAATIGASVLLGAAAGAALVGLMRHEVRGNQLAAASVVALLLVCGLALVLGLPVLLLICRSLKRDLSIAIPVSFLLAFMVWGIWGVLQALAKTAHIQMFIAAWLLHVVFISSGIIFLRRLSRT